MFAYLVVRVFLVPPVHDEARMIRFYIDTGNYLPPHAQWDAGNHLLVTMIGHWSTVLFGHALWTVRLFPLLTYPLFAFGVIMLLREVKDPRLRWAFGTALLAMPFLHEYFALFRGYGPALAFEVLGVLWLIRATNGAERRPLLFAFFFLALGVLSSLNLLPMLCISIALAVLAVLRGPVVGRLRRLYAIALVGGVPALFMVWYGYQLSSRDQLYAGGRSGLVSDTVGSLAQWTLGVRVPWVNYVLALVIGGVLVWAIVHVARKRFGPGTTPLFVLAMLLAGEIAGRILMASVLGMPWPEERTALHFIPLVLLLMAFSMDRWAVRWPWVSAVGLLVLFFPIRTIATGNVDHTSFWVDQAIPDAVFDTMAALEARSDRPLLISGHYHLSEAWNYGREQRGERAAPLDFEVFPQPVCDVLILDTTKHIAPAGFHTVFTAPTGRLVLKLRDKPLVGEPVFDTLLTFPSGTNEFIELWKPTSTESLVGHEHFVWIQAGMDQVPVSMARLVTELRTGDGQNVYYDHVFLGSMRHVWTPNALDVVRRVPLITPDVASAALYLYNPDRTSTEVGTVRIRVIRAGLPGKL